MSENFFQREMRKEREFELGVAEAVRDALKDWVSHQPHLQVELPKIEKEKPCEE